jgi:hypothetical protein
MKLACVSILFICVLAATFSQGILIAAFNMNQQFIATTLCENRNHPEIHCNGHCFLNKQLNNQQKQDGSANTGSKTRVSIQLFKEEFTTNNLSVAMQKAGVYAYYKYRRAQGFILSFFQPPQA